MKVAVCHHDLEMVGGAERLTLSAIEALSKKGHEVSLILAWFPSEKLEMLMNLFGKNLGSVKIVGLIPQRAKLFPRYQRLFSAVPLIQKVRHADLLLIFNTLVPYELARVVLKKRTVLFVHNPPLKEGNRVPRPYNTRSLMKIYYYGSLFFARRIRRFPPDVELLLCNSTFTKKAIKSVWGLEAKVIFPPVSVKEFNGSPEYAERAPCVVSVGRISPEKRIEQQVEAISKTPYLLKVVGSTQPGTSQDYYQNLRKRIVDYALGKKVNFETNIRFERLRQILSRAKIYVHTMFEEHFGISIVEAMASGCPVIMHKSGGAWTDIADKGRYAIGYERPIDLAEKIQVLMTDEKEWDYWHNKSLERAKEFDESVFQTKLVDVIERVAE